MSWRTWAAQRRRKLLSITAALCAGALWLALDPPRSSLRAQPSDAGLAEQSQTPQPQEQQPQEQQPQEQQPQEQQPQEQQPQEQQPQEQQPQEQQPQAPQERGRYLVHDVAMCVQCHSPRTDDGTLDARLLLRGAPIPLTSPFPSQQWATRSPRLAGLPGWTDEELITLLVTGARPNGRRPRPPMPEYHLTPADAAAVAAYLRSLPP